MFTATGGLYLGGSICITLHKLLCSEVFRQAFLSSGPQTHRAAGRSTSEADSL